MIEKTERLLSEKSQEEKSIDNITEDIKALLSVDSVSGHEQKLRASLVNVLEKFGCTTRIDKKGNLWVESHEKAEGKVLLNAHMDRVGPGDIKREGDRLVGRLDDTLGISMILSLLKEGYRPSLLFTVEEESLFETEENGQKVLKPRKLQGGVYNAGANHASWDDFWVSPHKPRLSITIDVTSLGKLGDGPAIYTSSGLHKPGKQFYFNPEVLKEIGKIVNSERIGTRYVEGNANDAIEFSFIPDLGVTAVEVPVENAHTDREAVQVSDVEKALKVLRIILDKAERL